MPDLSHYLEVILKDPVVEVVRIKKRFDSSSGSDESVGGFRGVRVCVRVCLRVHVFVRE